MRPKSDRTQEWTQASPALYTAYNDFILSRHSIQCSTRTIEMYEEILGRIFKWMVERGVKSPGDITVQLIREYIAGMLARKLSDSYAHSHARVIRTFDCRHR